MSDSSNLGSIGLVVEAPADADAARILVDRVLRARRSWIDEETLEHLRSWRGIEPDSAVTHWKQVRALAKAHEVSGHGLFSGEPGAPDARAARRALLLFTKLGMTDAVVLTPMINQSVASVSSKLARARATAMSSRLA
jgi:hypothetical protein